jgi:hypothetical protein
MNITEWNAVAGAPDISATLTAMGLDGATDGSIDQMFLNLIRHACNVETDLNAGVDSSQRTNYYSNSIREDGTFSGSVRIPVAVSDITVDL